MSILQQQKNPARKKRFISTLEFLKASLPEGSRILDLGTPNDLSTYISENGYIVENAYGVDFDLQPEIIDKEGYDAVTMFEVLEHLVNPMGVLQAVKAPKLYASVPLALWFAKAYRNQADEWDQHYHEFEDWQFEWLIKKSGWKINKSEKWVSPVRKIGFRPILRYFTPRYIIVEAERLK